MGCGLSRAAVAAAGTVDLVGCVTRVGTELLTVERGPVEAEGSAAELAGGELAGQTVEVLGWDGWAEAWAPVAEFRQG